MSNATRFKERLFTELQFSPRHLSPLRRLYRQMRGDVLGEDFSFHEVPGLHENMTWFYASSPSTLAAFLRCLTNSHLRESLTLVEGNAELLAACFVVVRGDTPQMDFHVDYGQQEIPAGVTGTLLTPLIEFDEEFGHLDYREGVVEHEYRYQRGDAILFDGKFEHRSQEAPSQGGLDRILVSWSLATMDARYQFAIRRVIESQSI